MKKRCYKQYATGYENYGGRGITICDEWLNSFEAFVAWSLANGYSDDLTIDRKDNDGNYEPSNCRWTDNFTQGANKRQRCDNTSGFVGVDFDEATQKWRARIQRRGERMHLGCFDVIEDAVKARKAAIAS